MTEEWRPLIYNGVDFQDQYEIQNTGKLRNTKTGRERKLTPNKKGYYGTVISRGADCKQYIKIHRAVAENFCEGDKSLTVNHIDGDKSNNSADNLEYISDVDNLKHAAVNELMKHKLSFDDVKEIKKLYNKGVTRKVIAEKFGITLHYINDIMSGRTRVLVSELGLC